MDKGETEMTNIITPDFGKPSEEKELQVWVCDCGNSTFSLFNDARVQCAHCGNIICDTCADEEGWRRVLPTSPATAAEDNNNTIRIMNVGDVELARARVWRQLDEWRRDGKLEFVYGGHVDGGTRSWVNIDNEKDREHLLEQLRSFQKYVEGLKFPEEDAPELDLGG